MQKLKNNIFYAGISDPTLRSFGLIMKTDYGTTYNAYIIKSEKTALIDCVHEKFADDFIEKIGADNIDYIICNHTEPDHSGAMKKLIEKNPDITIVGTVAALRNLKEITNIEFKECVAKDGGELDLGNGIKLSFLITPGLNWPDTMMTYMPLEKVLFSGDVFGAHYCEDCIYNNDIIHFDKYEKAFKEYYDYIMSPFDGFVRSALSKIDEIDFEMICPGNGPVIATDIDDVIDKYTKYSSVEKSENNTMGIFYTSAYGYTREMAHIISQTAADNGYNVQMFDLEACDMEAAKKSLNSAEAIAVGTPTINKNAPETVWKLLSGIEAVNIKGKPCMVFGSYGWSGEAIGHIHSYLKLFKLDVFEKPFGCMFKMNATQQNELKEYTKRFLKSTNNK